MLYYLHQLHEFFGGLNVFQYQTFRAVSAALTAFVLSLIFGNYVIRRLISLKVGQPIRTKEEVHRLHELHGAKAGTPTMGGVLIIGSVAASALLWARPDNPFIWVSVFTLLYLGALGFADDYLKVTKKKSDGISSRTKLAAQVFLGVLIGAFFLWNPWFEDLKAHAQDLYVPFYKEPLLTGIGAGVLLFYALIIAGSSNAVNLTDGLDGLAAGCTVTVAFAYSILTYAGGNSVVATYLQIPFNKHTGELAVICMALCGAGLGFLWFNCHPARVFMGDTGSLAIGGLLGVVAICCKQELLLVIVGGIFVMEALSVILQVLSFKLTGKRIFAMSPIHHHFELKGWKENTVIVRFWILSLMFALLGLATLKLR
jgi:phospho-N-acetylmuramoyl-pentapeptide-transferase